MANDEELIIHTNSQADTQPTNSEETDYYNGESTLLTWGQLYPLNIKNKLPYSLTEEFYTVGRSSQCTISLTQHELGTKRYMQLSKLQFSIKRVTLDSGVFASYITDHSTNGTYINGERLGNNKMQMISNNDIIAVANNNIAVFLYLDMKSSMDDVPPELKRQYLVSRVIGRGGFGEVREVFEKRSTTRYAMKCVKIEAMGSSNIYNEIIVLYKTCHEHIVKMYDSLKTTSQVFFILEFMEGGDLAGKLKKERHLLEPVSKHIFYQCCLGLHYLHSNDIIHRDIKPGNILLSLDSEYPVVKIGDFGLSKLVTPTLHATTICGTPHYAAPELMYGELGGTYNNKVDVWSLGVILYLCLSGDLPFHKNRRDISLKEQVQNAIYSFSNKIWLTVSEDAKNIIRRMLVVNPAARIPLNEVLYSSWIYSDLKMKTRVSELSSAAKRKLIDDLYFPPAKKSSSGDSN